MAGLNAKNKYNFSARFNHKCMFCGQRCFTIKELRDRGYIVVKIYRRNYCCIKLDSIKYSDFPMATIEHIIPKCFGGQDNRKNYGIACAKCNHAKKNFLNLGILLFTEQGELDYADTR